MFNLFSKTKDKAKDENHLSLISIAALLIHSAKIDENFTEKEKTIIKKALIEMDANQILEFTKEVKNKSIEEKKLVIEALWNIIYSDKNADMYETNLMRRVCGLLYLDPKIVGDIKEKIKLNQ